MEPIRKTLLAGAALQIGSFSARPLSDACGDIERQNSNAVVLPVSGLFSKHDAPGRHVIGTPSHAVLFAAHMPYRIGFPGAIGDRALILRYGEDLADDQLYGGSEERLGFLRSAFGGCHDAAQSALVAAAAIRGRYVRKRSAWARPPQHGPRLDAPVASRHRDGRHCCAAGMPWSG